MSPEQHHAPKSEKLLERTEPTFDRVLAREDVQHMQILPGAQTELPLNGRFAEAATHKDGVGDQELVAFIRSGNHLYSLTVFEPVEEQGQVNYAINEVAAFDQPGQRALLLQVLAEDSPYALGSKNKPDVKLTLGNKGGITIESSSDNKTEVLYPREAQEASLPTETSDEKTAIGGLKRITQKAKQRLNSKTAAPLDLTDFRIWAPKTSDVAFVAHRQTKERERRSNQRTPSFDVPPASVVEGAILPRPPEIKNSAPTAEDLSAQREADEEQRAQAAFERRQQTEEELRNIESRFGEADRTALWKQSHYLFEKSKMWDEQDDAAAMRADDLAAEAYKSLSPEAKKAAYEYHELRTRLE